MIRGLELSVLPPDQWGWERGWILNLITSGQGLVNHAYVMKLLKTHEDRVESFQVD